ncbi:MAG TPA: GNAT family N-acetyltransferase [Jatrophihabitans sp.]|jgi:GNAT superfamily N-acetyltransferase|uniref:GNAT family N-acetyltransferase n=1 Tax=Jatrophihabitans sp. TaxID=1932789 RepID=UPI002F0A0F86
MSSPAIRLSVHDVGYDHPDARRLIAEVQAEYVQRYGGPDSSPVDPMEFQPPQGLFAVGYLGAEPVAMGGWRRHDDEHPQTAWAAPVAEVKRMYVSTAARGRGYARTVLAYLEDTAREAGVRWLLLETGSRQPEAVALYLSCGYQPVPRFGYYADRELAIHLGKDLTAAGQAAAADQPAAAGQAAASAQPAAAGQPRSAPPGR